MRCIKLRSIRGERKITRSAPGQQPLLFRARLRIQHGHIVADAIGNKQPLALPVLYHAGRLRAHRPRSHHHERIRVDDGKRIVPRVGHKQPGAVRRKRNPTRHAPHSDVLDHRIAGRIQHPHLLALLAENVEASAVGRKQNLERGCIIHILDRTSVLVRMHRAARPQRHREKRERCCGQSGCQQRKPRRRSSPHSNAIAPTHFNSSTVSTRSTLRFSMVCSRPLGQ